MPAGDLYALTDLESVVQPFVPHPFAMTVQVPSSAKNETLFGVVHEVDLLHELWSDPNSTPSWYRVQVSVRF